MQTRRAHLASLVGAGVSAALPRSLRAAVGDDIPPEGIGRGIRHLSFSDQGGRPDGVQVMLHRGHLYVGHMFNDGVTVLDARDPRALEAAALLHDRAEHAHASPAGRRRSDAARERRQHRAHASV